MPRQQSDLSGFRRVLSRNLFYRFLPRWAKSDTHECLSFVPHGLTGRTSGLFWHHAPPDCRGMTWLPEVVHGLTFGECDRMAILEIVGVNVRR